MPQKEAYSRTSSNIRKRKPRSNAGNDREMLFGSSKSVSTNVAKAFLKLVDKLFSRNPKLKKIFNRDKMKVSYSWMRNIGSRKSQDTIEKYLTQTRRRKSENATVQETLNVLLMDIVWPRIRYIRVKSHRPAELRFKRINWPQRA